MIHPARPTLAEVPLADLAFFFEECEADAFLKQAQEPLASL
jgi:hypothetical protein